jgi:hypothetical protein
MAKKKIKKEIDPLLDEMKKFDSWFMMNLDRTFSDAAILSVLRYHVIKSYVDSGISFEEMVNSMGNQFEDLRKKSCMKALADEISH